jgi:uncharacterized OB-fold protein
MMNDKHTGKRFPRPTALTADYWEGCRNQQLLIQRCVHCDHLQFYPRSICNSCAGQELDWLPVSGRGTIRSYTVVRHPVSKAYADEVPYVIALITLAEGPTMMSALCNCDPEKIETGMAVEVVFEQWSEEITMPKFQTASEN